MQQQTRWFEYGEPIGNGRVWVIIRTEYSTGPFDMARTDDIEKGTIPIGNLDLLDEKPFVGHVHEDDSLILGALPVGAEERLLDGFREVSRGVRHNKEMDGDGIETEFDGHEYDTIVDCLHFLEDAMSGGELPFDPTDMDEEARMKWLDDIADAEAAINPYTSEGNDGEVNE